MSVAKAPPWWQVTGRWSGRDFVGLLIVVVLLPLILPVLLLYVLYGFFLHLAIWLIWCTHGQKVLFVYSNSPLWKDYIEQQILPKLPQSVIVLNWSERKAWRRVSLAAHAFYFFGGHREFNPLAVVFRPFRPTRTFRFWKGFKDYKHGKPEQLVKMQGDFLSLVGTREGVGESEG